MEERWGGPPAVPAMTWSAFELMLAHGAFGVSEKPLVSVSAIAVSEGGLIVGGVGLQRVAGGTIDFAGTAKLIFMLLFCAGPPCQALVLTIQ